MGTLSIRWYYEADAKKWEKAEAKGKLGPNQAILLNYWRKAKAKFPNLKSIANYGGELVVEDTGERS